MLIPPSSLFPLQVPNIIIVSALQRQRITMAAKFRHPKLQRERLKDLNLNEFPFTLQLSPAPVKMSRKMITYSTLTFTSCQCRYAAKPFGKLGKLSSTFDVEKPVIATQPPSPTSSSSMSASISP